MSTGASTTEYSMTRLMAGVVLALCVVALGLCAVLKAEALPGLATVLVPVAMGALSLLGGSYAVSRGLAKAGSRTLTVGTSEYALAEPPKDPPVPGASLILPLLLAAGLGASACGMSTESRLNLVSISAAQVKDIAAKPWSDACKAKAEKCIADGVAASKDCKPWVDCQTGLKQLYVAHHLVQCSVEKAAWWLLNGDEATAKKVLAVAIGGLAEAWKLARAEGLVK